MTIARTYCKVQIFMMNSGAASAVLLTQYFGYHVSLWVLQVSRDERDLQIWLTITQFEGGKKIVVQEFNF